MGNSADFRRNRGLTPVLGENDVFPPALPS
jgi:hypothetical protein